MRIAILIVTLLLASNAWAIDPECDEPPVSDQTRWNGADGDLSYCTSISALTTTEVLFNGVLAPEGSLMEITPPGTYKKFDIGQRFGTGSFTINSIAVSGEPVPVVTGTVTFRSHLPPVLLDD